MNHNRARRSETDGGEVSVVYDAGARLRLPLVIALAALAGGCVIPPPQLIILPALIPLLLVGIVLMCLGPRSLALKAEGVFLTALYLIFGAGYALAVVGWFAGYVVSFIVALLSGLILAGAAWVFRRDGVTFIHPKYAALFGFLLFFLINFGHNVSASEAQDLPSPGLGASGGDLFLEQVFLGQLPYASLLLAPTAVAVWAAINRLRGRRSWTPDEVVAVNMWALWGFLVASILLVVILRGHTMSTPFLGLEPSWFGPVERAPLENFFLVLSDYRALFFLISAHDLLVVVCLTVGVIAVGTAGKLHAWRNYIAVGGLAAAVLLAFLPYYVGQEALLDFVVRQLGGEYAARVKLRGEFLNIRGLYPSSIALKHLLVSLTAGGLATVALNLPGVSIKLGK